MKTQTTRGWEVVGWSWRIAIVLLLSATTMAGAPMQTRISRGLTVQIRLPDREPLPLMTQVTVTAAGGFTRSRTLSAPQITFGDVPEGPVTIVLKSPGRDAVTFTTERQQHVTLHLPAAREVEQFPTADGATVDVGQLRIPEEARHEVNLGADAIEGGALSKALEHLNRALQIAPGFFEAHFNRGVALARMNSFPEAEASLQEALTLQPEHPTARRQLGWILLQAGRHSDALDALRSSLVISPQDARCLALLGLAYGRLGQQVLASSFYRRAIAEQTDLNRAYVLLGHSQLALDRPGEALRHFQEYVARWPDGPDADEARAMIEEITSSR